jgi:hypothetical protein
MRCEGHRPFRTKVTIVGAVRPVGFSETALVCGSKGCREPAHIWLEADEMASYKDGERIFECFTGSAMKVRAE